jgi:hypothetical protein
VSIFQQRAPRTPLAKDDRQPVIVAHLAVVVEIRISLYAAQLPSGPRYLQLGILLQELGKLPESRVAYRQALTLDPTLTEARTSLDALAFPFQVKSN